MHNCAPAIWLGHHGTAFTASAAITASNAVPAKHWSKLLHPRRFRRRQLPHAPHERGFVTRHSQNLSRVIDLRETGT